MPISKGKVVITGAAGFIGMHLSKELLSQGYQVTGIDHMKPSYGGDWSKRRKKILEDKYGLKILNFDLAETGNLKKLTEIFENCAAIVHLAAWPGVRQGQLEPYGYSLSNLNAFVNVIEAVNRTKPAKFLFASSSSIYGDMGRFGPVQENQANGLNLKSFYAATKWSNEILAMQHQKIHIVPTAALRFFTVYGEYGRPDMAYWTFLEKMIQGKTIELFGKDGGSRNFTYIDDAVTIVKKIIESNFDNYQPINIACGEPMPTINLLNTLADAAKVEFKIEMKNRPGEDVEKTWADLSKVNNLIGTIVPTEKDIAVHNFVNWYLKHVKH